MIFVIDETLLERTYDCGFPTLGDAAEAAGHTVYRVKYRPIAQTIEGYVPFSSLEPVVAYGTIQFCNAFQRTYGKTHSFTPGLFYKSATKLFHEFAVQYGDWMLNSDYVILPYGEVKRRFKDQEAQFIKPLSGLKDFVGQVVNYRADFDTLGGHNPLFDDMLCVVSEPKDIKAEFRYVIVEGKVITGSEYRWDNILDVRTDTHPTCDALANLVATHHWQPDSVYVCDIALTYSGDARIIELNAFSSSGLYACDTNKIVAAVAAAAEREFRGEPFDSA